MFQTVSSPTIAEQLRFRIQQDGPISFHDWMQAALYDPTHGYYRSNSKKWGREGDYLTSPGSSSLYAATFAGYFAHLYDTLNQPPRFTILEAGAGDGTFARGVLETLQEHFPEVFTASRYVIDEISTGSSRTAQEQLVSFADRVEFDAMPNVSIDAGVIFSNELLDAFPVHRVTVRDGRLLEFYVDVDEEEKFVWRPGPLSDLRIEKHFARDGVELIEGQSAEVNLAMIDWLEAASQSLSAGYVVTVDYGTEEENLYDPFARYHGTLRSFKQHRMVDNILDNPGEQDLTSTVNWTTLRKVGEGCGLSTIEFQQQDQFLLANGVLTQLERELEQCETESEKLLLSTAAREMILPGGMASHFQVLVQEKI